MANRPDVDLSDVEATWKAYNQARDDLETARCALGAALRAAADAGASKNSLSTITGVWPGQLYVLLRAGDPEYARKAKP